MEESSGGNLSCKLITKRSVSEACKVTSSLGNGLILEKQGLWRDDVKIELLSHNHQRCVWGKQGAAFDETASLQLLSSGVEP